MYIILNKQLEIVGEITTFLSINWEEEYLSQSGGDFEIKLPSNEYLDLNIDNGYFIYKTDSLKFGIVNNVKYEDTTNEDERIEQYITIKGEMGESILKRRVLSSQLNKSGTMNDIFKEVISNHFTNPNDIKRKINLSYIEDKTYSVNFSKSITGCTVSELFESMCSSKEYSYRVLLDLEQKQFFVKLIQGKDKSNDIVFNKSDNNLSKFTYIKSTEKFVSHVLVGGEIKNGEKILVTVNNENVIGLDRIEKYLDKNNVSSKDLNEDEYRIKLKEEGKSELSKYSVTNASEFDIFLNNYEIGVDFNLGDKVRIVDENLGIENITRVLAVLYSSDENGVETTQLTLGSISEITLKEDDTTSEENEKDKSTSDAPSSYGTSGSLEFIKIKGYSNNRELKDIEFGGGLTCVAKNTYILTIKNNSSETVNKISFKNKYNLLRSYNEIKYTIYVNKTHTLKDEIHTYDCDLSPGEEINMIIYYGEPYKDESTKEPIDASDYYTSKEFTIKKSIASMCEIDDGSASYQIWDPVSKQYLNKIFLNGKYHIQSTSENIMCTTYNIGKFGNNYSNLEWGKYLLLKQSKTKVTFHYSGNQKPFISQLDSYEKYDNPQEIYDNLGTIITDGLTLELGQLEGFYIWRKSGDNSEITITVNDGSSKVLYSSISNRIVTTNENGNDISILLHSKNSSSLIDLEGRKGIYEFDTNYDEIGTDELQDISNEREINIDTSGYMNVDLIIFNIPEQGYENID